MGYLSEPGLDPSLVALCAAWAILWFVLLGVAFDPYLEAADRGLTSALHRAAARLDAAAKNCRDVRELATQRLARALRFVTGRFRPVPQPIAMPNVTSQRPTVIVLGMLALAVMAGTVQYALLADVTPDLAGIPPAHRARGTVGWWIASASPLVLVVGEVFGGVLADRKGPGRPIFLVCFIFELVVASSRSVSFAYDPYAESGYPISIPGIIHGLAFLALAVVLPVILFFSGKYLAPFFRRLRFGAAALLALRWFAVGLWNLTIALAAAAVALTLSLVWLAVTLWSAGWAATGGLLLIFIYPLARVTGFVALAIPVYGTRRVCGILSKIPRPRPRSGQTGRWVFTLLVVAAGLLSVGCDGRPEAHPPLPDSFESIHAGQLAAPIDSAKVLAQPMDEVGPFLVERCPVHEVEEQSLYACIVDATASVAAPLRRQMLEFCAERVANAPPSATAVIFQVNDRGGTTEAPIEWRPALHTVSRCEADPPVPHVPSQGTLFDNEVERVRKRVGRTLEHCSRRLEAQRAEAVGRIGEQAAAFVEAAMNRFGDRVYDKTDLFQSLARVPDLARNAEHYRGVPVTHIVIDLLSDLVHDATWCDFSRVTPRRTLINCSDPALDDVERFLARDDVEMRFHRIVPRTAAPRAASERWLGFWELLAPGATFFTWSPDDAGIVPPGGFPQGESGGRAAEEEVGAKGIDTGLAIQTSAAHGI
jgi:hypothetical protein